MHDQARDYVARWRTDAGVRVLDLGGRDINGTPRDLFPNAAYDVVDVEPGDNVNIVADAREWEPPHSRYDLAICTEVFEHVEDWPAILATAVKALDVGGRLIITCAGQGRFPHSGRREAPAPDPDEWYRNLTVDELAAELRRHPLNAITIETLGADLRATATKMGAMQPTGGHDPYTGEAV